MSYNNCSNPNIASLTSALNTLSSIYVNNTSNYNSGLGVASWGPQAGAGVITHNSVNPSLGPYSYSSNTNDMYNRRDYTSINDKVLDIPHEVMDIIMAESTSVAHFNSLNDKLKVKCWAFRRGEIFFLRSESILKILSSKSTDHQILSKALNEVQENELWKYYNKKYTSIDDLSHITQGSVEDMFDDCKSKLPTHLKSKWWKDIPDNFTDTDWSFTNYWSLYLIHYFYTKPVARALEKILGISFKYLTPTNHICIFNNPYLIANKHSPEWRDKVEKWEPEAFFTKYNIKDSILKYKDGESLLSSLQLKFIKAALANGGGGASARVDGYGYDTDSYVRDSVSIAKRSELECAVSELKKGVLLAGAGVLDEGRLVMAKVKYDL